jgi:hypothetical protein
MKSSIFFRTLFLAATTLAFSFATYAQEAAQNATQPSPTTHKHPPQKKSHTVWTDDNITAVRSPADAYIDREQQQAVLKQASAKQAVASQADPAKPAHPGAPSALSNPKTPDDADKMIAWEDRDLAAQQQFVAELQSELAKAPPQDQARLQNLLQQRQQVVAEIQKERQALIDQKKQLVKKATTADNTASSNPSN